MKSIIINVLFCILILCELFLVVIFVASLLSSEEIFKYIQYFNRHFFAIASGSFDFCFIVCISCFGASRLFGLQIQPANSILTFVLLGFLFLSGVVCVCDKWIERPVRFAENGNQLEVFIGDSWKVVENNNAIQAQQALSRSVASSLAVSLPLTIMMPVMLLNSRRRL